MGERKKPDNRKEVRDCTRRKGLCRGRRNVIYYNITYYYTVESAAAAVTVYSAQFLQSVGVLPAIYICIPHTPLIPTIYMGFCKVAGALNIHKHMFDIIIYFALSRPRSTYKLCRCSGRPDDGPPGIRRQSTINIWTEIRAFVCGRDGGLCEII